MGCLSRIGNRIDQWPHFANSQLGSGWILLTVQPHPLVVSVVIQIMRLNWLTMDTLDSSTTPPSCECSYSDNASQFNHNWLIIIYTSDSSTTPSPHNNGDWIYLRTAVIFTNSDFSLPFSDADSEQESQVQSIDSRIPSSPPVSGMGNQSNLTDHRGE